MFSKILNSQHRLQIYVKLFLFSKKKLLFNGLKIKLCLSSLCQDPSIETELRHFLKMPLTLCWYDIHDDWILVHAGRARKWVEQAKYSFCGKVTSFVPFIFFHSSCVFLFIALVLLNFEGTEIMPGEDLF